jgi:proteic killer suppression protein
MFKTKVVITKDAKKNLIRLPVQAVIKLKRWASQFNLMGLRETRKIKNYHDEPLQRDRKGQRFIRFNKAHRAFYIVKEDGQIEIAEIFEINKHKY